MGLDYEQLYEDATRDAKFWKEAYYNLDSLLKEIRDIFERKIDYDEQQDQSEL